MLTVSHFLTNVETLGPNKRLVLYFTGCSKDCKGCCSPELKNKSNGRFVDPLELAGLINTKIKETNLQGLTISGGDPLEQDEGSFSLFLSNIEIDDIILYTGYSYEEVQNMKIYNCLKKHIAVLKCGRYDITKDEGKSLYGSENQKLIFFKEQYENLYKEYRKQNERALQIYTTNSAVYFAGLPKKNKENVK